MATFEESEVTAALTEANRAQALAEMLVSENTAHKFIHALDINQRHELSTAYCTLRRLLAGNEAPPAYTRAPTNLRQLRLVGRIGPAFGEDGGVEIAVSDNAAVKVSKDVFKKFDNQPKGGGTR